MSFTFHQLVIDSKLTGTYAGLQNYDQSTMNIDQSDPWNGSWNISNKGFALDSFQKGVKLSNGVITLESSFDIPGVRTCYLHDFEFFCPFIFFVLDAQTAHVFVEQQKMDFKKGILETSYKFIQDEKAINCLARIFVNQKNPHLVEQELVFDKSNVKVFRRVSAQPNIYNIQYNNGLEYQDGNSMQMLSGEGTLADSHHTKVAFASAFSCSDIKYLDIQRKHYGATCFEVFEVSAPVRVFTVMGSEKDFDEPYDKVRSMLADVNNSSAFGEVQENSWKTIWNRGLVEVAGKMTNPLRAALYQLWAPVRSENYLDRDNLLNTSHGLAFMMPLYVMMRPSVAKTMIDRLPSSPLLALHAWNCYRASGDRNRFRASGDRNRPVECRRFSGHKEGGQRPGTRLCTWRRGHRERV